MGTNSEFHSNKWGDTLYEHKTYSWEDYAESKNMEFFKWEN